MDSFFKREYTKAKEGVDTQTEPLYFARRGNNSAGSEVLVLLFKSKVMPHHHHFLLFIFIWVSFLFY
jgi:hypothetical protein